MNANELAEIVADMGAILRGYIEENKRLRALLADAAHLINGEMFPAKRRECLEASK